MTDKRARLLSDLRQIGSNNSGVSSRSFFQDISDSDLDVSETDEPMEVGRDNQSEFSEDDSDSDDDLEGHLQLLWPRELETLGIDALKGGQFESAIKFLNLARLEWTERLAKSIASGTPVQLDAASVMDDWIVCKYMHLAVSHGEFVERSKLVEEFEAMSVRTAKASTASTQPSG